ncbi:hypothetical protein LCGC14_0357930 [marine sediment metagenome]|uniref:Uncharacterized protein n=1 Tax=marine sediment metagenome TaxID=412755 RepID=A0A0F9WGZ5_9ZZZZ
MKETCKDCQYYEKPVPADAEFFCNKKSLHSADYRPCRDFEPKENTMNKELIEKLKKPELAQAFGLLTDEERAILRQADKANCIVFTNQNDWFVALEAMDWIPTHTYILKPGYKPEPEYLIIEVGIKNGDRPCRDFEPKENAMNKELIEKLQDPKQAQPLCLRTEAEQAILTKAGPDNCLILSARDYWSLSGNVVNLTPTAAYILKPDYEPQPEYEDIEIRVGHGNSLYIQLSGTGSIRTTLYKAANKSNFVCFHYKDGASTRYTGDVPNWLRKAPDQTMYARFIRSKP